MADLKTITMSMRELDRLKTIAQVAEGSLRASVAAIRLQLTKRQVNRLVKRYRDEGHAGVMSRQRGQPGHRQLAAGLAQQALSIIRERYPDFGPTLACEKLREVHGLVLSRETVRKLMSEAGLWTPRRLRSVAILPADESPSLCRRAELAIHATRPVDVTKKPAAASCS